jgi:predicted heme/steroid binding protein
MDGARLQALVHYMQVTLLAGEAIFMKVYGPQELSESNGKNETRTLVAVDGNVYDVSKSRRWIEGVHMKRHNAGKDLTSEIKSAPHGPDVLARFEQVGTYEEAPPAPSHEFKAKVEFWLDRYPFFRRHPHPALVHFPMGLLLSVPVFQLSALALGSLYTEWAAVCSLILGFIFIPPSMFAGYFTWWINYDRKEWPLIRIKRRMAWAVLVLAVCALSVRLGMVTDPLQLRDTMVILYCSNLLALAAGAAYVGFLGGKLTFPFE